MDYLINLITQLPNNPEHGRWLFLSLVALTAIIIGISVTIIIGNMMDPVKAKLNNIASNTPHTETNSRLDNTLESLGSILASNDPVEREGITRQLMHAGFHSQKALTTFYAIKVSLTLVVAITSVLLTRYIPSFTLQDVVVYSAVSAFIALLLPNFIIKHLAQKRMRLLRNAFPDALDLLVVSTEAGLGFIAALNRIAHEMQAVAPELGDELLLVCQKIRVGMQPVDALKQMVNRTGLTDIRGMVAVIAQSIKLGANLADSLREYSDELRHKRMQLAEELAAKIGTKMIFPLVLCLWPGFFIVTVGPAIVAVLDAFNR